MSDSTTPGSYTEEAAIQDELLDRTLGEIRRQADELTITIREAADLRVAALEHHLEAIRALRDEYLGEEGTPR